MGWTRTTSAQVSWIFRIARNVIVDRHRARAKSPPGASIDAAAALSRPATQVSTVILDEALSRLPEEEYREIAEVSGATPDAARMRIYRARLALREQLGSSRSPAPLAGVDEPDTFRAIAEQHVALILTPTVLE